MRAVRGWIALLLLVATVGCGGAGGDDQAGDDRPSTTPETTAAAASEPPALPVAVQGMTRVQSIEDLSGKASVQMELVAFEGGGDAAYGGSSFQPTLIKVDPGAAISLVVANTGKTEHNFSIESQKIDVNITPGKKAKLDVAMPKKDGLRFSCTLHPGMVGAFYSQEGQDVQN